RQPEAAVPDHDGAAAVLTLGDRALEVAVVERMVLHLDREPLVLGVARGSARYGPRLEHPVHLEPQVVVEPRRIMLLDDEARVLRSADGVLSAGLLGPREIALGAVGGELFL